MTDADQVPGLATIIEDLVAANHILFAQGVVDGFGHVSARHPGRPERFLLARSMAPGLVGPADILEFALDGTPVEADGPKPYLERFIHGEIYRARPDVMAVVHSHSPAVIPFGVVPDAPLRPICHMSGFLGDAAPVFEIREAAGPASDMLIRTPGLGAALADRLGTASVVLMRGHGSTVVGADLRQTVFRAIYTEVNAKLQAEALRLGSPVFLTAAEAEAASATNDGQIDRAWNLWLEKAKAATAADGR
jgi:ribulose-5-phosphate 4-epimerase/fuculose-1-phosphate aldolase